MTALHTSTLHTPAGPLSLVADGGVLVAAGFTSDPESLQHRMDGRRRSADLRRMGDLGEITDAMAAYLDGDLEAPDALAVEQSGTPQQRRLWAALREVPPGTTVTYSELARRAGNPAAVRAAGTACGRNLIAPVVPCHRVLRTDGSLGGYYYGLEPKRWLLGHERRHAGRELTLAVR